MKNQKHFLATSIALALLASASGSAMAQEQPAEDNDEGVEVIEVRGLRSSLDMAAQIKRNSDKVVDAIVADDIGKFPDTTTAAALQRIPGVQVTTGDNNEITGPIIRGIGDILTTLDGREIFTGVGRGFAFQDLPAEALAGADVFKSNTADLIEGGVAGVVNLQLHKPLNFDEGLTSAFNTRVFYGDNVEKANYNIGGLVSNHWSNEYGDMGALFNISYSDIDFDRPVSYNCDPRSGTNGPQGGEGAILPTCVGGVSQFGGYQRPQFNMALQWVTPSGLELYADGIYTEYKSDWESDFIFSDIFAAESITNVELTDDCGQYRVQGAGFGGTPDDPLQDLCIGQSARFNNVPGLSSTQAKETGTDQYLVAFGARYNTGNWQMDADFSYQRSHTENRSIIVDVGKQIEAVDIVINNDGYGTTQMPGSPLSDASDFRFANSLVQDLNDAVGEQYAFEGNAVYFMQGLFTELQMGVRYADRDSVFRATPPGGPASPGGNRETLVDSVGLPDDFLITSPTNIPYINNGENWVTPDRDFLINNTETLRQIYGAPSGDPDWDPARNYDADEQTYSAYVQGKYGYEFSNGMFIDGLLGVRATRTDRSLTGTGLVRPAPTEDNPNPPAVPTPVTTDTGETNFLPNFSARLEVTEDVQLRFTAARTLARPAFGDLNPGLTYDVPINANIRPNGSGGNPDLKPQKSNAYDATVEYYFAPSSYIATAIYYRTLKDRTVVEVSPEVIDGIEYNITRPRNAASATLQGVEVSGQLFFDSLIEQTPDWLNGFGLMANFTLADSEITTENDPLQGEPLQGVSKHSYTAGVLYENHGFTGRLVYTYRSEYSEFLIGGALKPEGAGEYFNKVKGNGRVDFSLGYDINEHLTVSIDGTNLNGETYRSYFGTPAFPHDVRDDERTFGLSIRGSY
ncbi:TonB-dependent receptor [Alteromonas pelagimontana]|uniref:TonB-dependent receptor n=1 Tax=Alteromonas pelagimontana TaxID=1858656 RepID=A0A6M4MAA1_9ALTE|nr:TonB-dependent receptor [Alteromonas pelagimontana]QJR79957.1 TonB-dependent receptor [Alteromonas pelagimontana]